MVVWGETERIDSTVPVIEALMQVTTTRGNVYTYSPRTNEIVLGGLEDACSDSFTFKSFVPFHEMPNLCSFIINVTEQCNLRCTYCCYSGIYENTRVHGQKSITEDDIPTLIKFIDEYAAKEPINISFYGGEPLLHYELLKSVILVAEKRWEQNVSFYVGTNGTLLDQERIDWLVEHHVMIAISVDGTREFHDRYRKSSHGNGSFNKTYSALSYLKCTHPNYFKDKVLLLTTVTAFDDLAILAESWHQDPVLNDKAPTTISALAPNFNEGVPKREWQDVFESHKQLLEIYEKHRDWVFLKAYFKECVMNWEKRPIMDVGNEVPLSTCMPLSEKIFIDSYGKLHVCEKISNCFSIGNVMGGIDWSRANKIADSYHTKRKARCSHCSAVRMCSLCLTSIEFSEQQMDVLCHNERLYAKINFWLFCEMAERGMLE